MGKVNIMKNKTAFSFVEMLMVMIISTVLISSLVPVLTMRKLSENTEFNTVKCIKVEGAANLTSTACTTTINRCLTNQMNACKTIENIADNGTDVQKNSARKVFRDLCDKGSEQACKYFVNSCKKDSVVCDIVNGELGCNTGTDANCIYYDLKYYMDLDYGETNPGRLRIQDVANTYYSNNLTNVKNSLDSWCANPCTSNVTACYARGGCSTPSTAISSCNSGTVGACNVAYINNWNRTCRHIKSADETLGDGAYTITPTGVTNRFSAYCDMRTDGGGWTLIGKGREGWTWNDAGQNTTTELVTNPTTNTVATLPATTVQAIAGKYIKFLDDGIRIKRNSGLNYGYGQEIRMKPYNMSAFSWNFAEGYDPDNSIFASRYNANFFVDGPFYVNSPASDSYYSFPSNDCKRVFTWAWYKHNYQMGWSTGHYCTIDLAPTAWQYTTELNVIPQSTVWIRDNSISTPRATIQRCNLDLVPIDDVACTLAYNNNWNRSCKQIKEVWTDAGSNIYRITPTGVADKFKVYCNMTDDGGGWTLVMKQKSYDGITLQGDTAYWTSSAQPPLNDNIGNMSETDDNLVSAAFTKVAVTLGLMLKASNETTRQYKNISAANAFSAFPAPTEYADDCNANKPNWFIHATTYPSSQAICSARFDFNFLERYNLTPSYYCGSRWGWAANENGCGAGLGSHDVCGGLGGFGSSYGSGFMNSDKNIWQYGTLYLYAR